MRSGPSLPATLVIGAAGHRKIEDGPRLEEAIASVIRDIENLVPRMRNTPLSLTVLSPLAEGADRIVARQVLKLPGSRLEVVLPMDRESYVRDFPSLDSRREFDDFLASTRAVRRISGAGSRTDAYCRAGRFVVDHCDVLIAIWDGAPGEGPGGTADVVAYARSRGCPLFWIDPAPGGKIRFEPGNGLRADPFRDQDVYNSESVRSSEVRRLEKGLESEIRAKAAESGLDPRRLDAPLLAFLPHYARADVLARKYRNLYARAGGSVYLLAALAASTAAFQAIFTPDKPLVALFEVLCIVAVLAIVGLGHFRKWHSRWIDRRFLAERFRSALFVAVAGADMKPLEPPRHLSLAYSARDWIVSAFLAQWSRLVPPAPPDPAEIEALKRFMTAAWIDPQIAYHASAARRLQARHVRLAAVGYALFGVTLVAAFLHVVHAGSESVLKALSFLAIAAPAAAGGLGALRTHREFQRNARRSAEMARHLEDIERRMEISRGRDEILGLVGETEEIMLNENADWRVVVRFHEIEPSA
jgi:hypothetical protein